MPVEAQRPEGTRRPLDPAEASTTAPPAFVAQLSERAQQARATIDCATAAGEHELAAAHAGELEGLVDLAAQHDVAMPDTVAYLARRNTPAPRRHPADDVVLDVDAGGGERTGASGPALPVQRTD